MNGWMSNRLSFTGFDSANTLGSNENRSFKNLCDSDWWERPLLGPGHGRSGPHLIADRAYGGPPSPRFLSSSPTCPVPQCPLCPSLLTPTPTVTPRPTRGGGRPPACAVPVGQVACGCPGRAGAFILGRGA